MSTGTGVNVSKANTYAVLEKPAGVNVSKASTYTVLEKPAGVNVSKAVVYTVLIPNNSNPPVWPSFTFSSGTVGSPYSQQFDLSPAASPTTYTLDSGTLPPGLALTNVSEDVGQIAGNPTTAGSYTFKLKATNTFGSAVSPLFTIAVSTPSGGGVAAYGWVA